MGWGCYKHEWDAGSDAWELEMTPLCNERLKTHHDWGRDGAICPKCYVEETKLLREALASVRYRLDWVMREMTQASRRGVASGNKLRAWADALLEVQPSKETLAATGDRNGPA